MVFIMLSHGGLSPCLEREDWPGLCKRIISYPSSFNSDIMVYGRPEVAILYPIVEVKGRPYINLEDYSIEYMLGTIGFETDEVIFMDTLEYHVNKAAAAGVKSVLYENAEQLEEELTRLGFRFAPAP